MALIGAPKPKLIGKATASVYLTQCKVCRSAVYQHETWVWAQQPLGISHQSCVEGAS